VCNNTLNISLSDAIGAIKVPHSTKFDATEVKKALGVGVSTWDTFISGMRALADRRVSQTEAERFVSDVVSMPHVSAQATEKSTQTVMALFNGQGIGSQLAAANDTAWGLLNAVTEYVDHERRARSPGNRLDSAWFGQGAALKQRALDSALQLVA
jgi:phage/plasmid-like protein (TIGR03299 family)